jgi:hypothetical protein
MIYLDGNIDDDNYEANTARAIHAVFSASQLGKQALESLEEHFCYTSLDDMNPSESALYRQGQASVIYQIRQWIRNVDRGIYNKTGDNNGN